MFGRGAGVGGLGLGVDLLEQASAKEKKTNKPYLVIDSYCNTLQNQFSVGNSEIYLSFHSRSNTNNLS